MEKSKRISCILKEMNEVDSKLSKLEMKYKSLKAIKSTRYMNITANVKKEEKYSHISFNLEEDFIQAVYQTLHNCYQEKIQENLKKLGELQETLKNL